jgi:hypothetical protein
VLCTNNRRRSGPRFLKQDSQVSLIAEIAFQVKSCESC